MNRPGRNLLIESLTVALASAIWSTGLYANVVLVDNETQKAFELYQAGNKYEAIPLITMKAYQGDIAAQYNLAVIYAQNQESELDRQEFEFWLNRVAESGDAEGQFNLAMMYYGESEENNNLERAVAWLNKSAQNGFVKAQYNLGYLGFSNLETGITRKKAAAWLQKAARADNDRAIKLVKVLQKNRSVGAPKMYGMDLQLRATQNEIAYAIKYDDTEVFAFPATRQKPLLVLNKAVKVEIAEKRSDWLGVRLEDSYPSWVAKEELVLRGATATVAGLEASMYVEPVIDQEVFKIGVVNSEEVLKILEIRNGWVKVVTPGHFLAWIKESDVVEISSE